MEVHFITGNPNKLAEVQAILGDTWFLQALGHGGLNNILLGYEDKSAHAVCTFAFSDGPGHEPMLFEGRVLVSPTIAHKGAGF
ncbi:MAG: hypothetical protein LQ341_002249 [Variospora aurantia]|nr:MAG: hypothetical protein LQ341_002249 [Variospora aurantia]